MLIIPEEKQKSIDTIMKEIHDILVTDGACVKIPPFLLGYIENGYKIFYQDLPETLLKPIINFHEYKATPILKIGE